VARCAALEKQLGEERVVAEERAAVQAVAQQEADERIAAQVRYI